MDNNKERLFVQVSDYMEKLKQYETDIRSRNHGGKIEKADGKYSGKNEANK